MTDQIQKPLIKNSGVVGSANFSAFIKTTLNTSKHEIDEALSLPEAIRAMTASSAYQLGLGDVTGSLRPGMAADLVVLGRNLFEIPTHEIAATPVVMTMCDGAVTHDTLS